MTDPVFRRGELAQGHRFDNLDQVPHEFLSRNDLGKRANRPVDLGVSFHELQNRGDRGIALTDEHSDNQPFLLNVLRDHTTRHREASDQSEQRLGCPPVCEPFGRFDPRTLFPRRFGEFLHRLGDLFRGGLTASEEIEHGDYSTILVSENGSIRAF